MGVRLLVVSDATLVRLGLTAALQDHPDVTLAGLAGCAAEGRQLAAEVDCDVIAVDAALPDEDGLALAGWLRAAEPARGVVLIAPRESCSGLTPPVRLKVICRRSRSRPDRWS